MESKQQLDDLRGAFRGLSERHHRIIVLRELEGKSYSQIGDELGMSKVVVESTLFRARRRLNEEFQDLCTGRRCEHVRQIIAARRDQPESRLGLRDRRRLKHHLEHCRPCRREAYAAGLAPGLESRRVVERAAAAVLPVPGIRLLRLLSRGGAALHQGAVCAASPVAGYAGSATSLADPGRLAATAATALAAALGGGLIAGAGQAPAGVPRHVQRTTAAHPGGSAPSPRGAPALGPAPRLGDALIARHGTDSGTGSGRRRSADRIRRPAVQSTPPATAAGTGGGTASPAAPQPSGPVLGSAPGTTTPVRVSPPSTQGAPQLPSPGFGVPGTGLASPPSPGTLAATAGSAVTTVESATPVKLATRL